jgi:hypothetical protein
MKVTATVIDKPMNEIAFTGESREESSVSDELLKVPNISVPQNRLKYRISVLNS